MVHQHVGTCLAVHHVRHLPTVVNSHPKACWRGSCTTYSSSWWGRGAAPDWPAGVSQMFVFCMKGVVLC
eukprot:10261107-Alexandrium_andersonii.AAC.1